MLDNSKRIFIYFLWVVFLLSVFYTSEKRVNSQNDRPSTTYHLPPITYPLNPYPIGDGTPVPNISAQAVVVQDAIGRSMLYEKNSGAQMVPASTTKLMTALVALKLYPDLDLPLNVTSEDHTIGQTMDLVKGEVLSARSLLAGLLIRSGNDAALTLANNVPGGYDAFVKEMNSQAKVLGLAGTHYQNPSGLDQYNHVTTARDLAVLITEVAKYDVITDLMLKKSFTVIDLSGSIPHNLITTNELLGDIPGLKAAKTGFTENAGECLVTYVERDGHGIVTVVLRSQDRFGESRALIDWAYDHHTWLVPPEL